MATPQLDGLRSIRASMRLTQGQFASLLGVSRRSVVRWEQGGARPHAIVMRYAHLLSHTILANQEVVDGQISG